MKIYLTSTAHNLATEFAREQVTPEKSKSVYLNTLSVYAVDRYLRTLDIQTNFSEGDWRNSLWRALLDTADLAIPGVGKIECRSILPNQTKMKVAAKAEDTIGYVAVQFAEALDAVQLVGFIPVASIQEQDQIALSDLQPIEEMLDHVTPVIRLWQWTQGIVDTTWKSIDQSIQTATEQLQDLTTQPAFAFRYRHAGMEVSRYRELSLMQSQLKLVIERIAQENTSKIQIIVKICPVDDRAALSPDLQLIVSSSETVLKPAVKDIGNFIEKRFTGELGERFSLQIVQGNAVFIEDYEI
ncbi:DUF1822 family protein [Leptolyngbya sp. GGD]|uniref:DUF1822 family protein n=1 Tax=Leptolyngbya sp. GGD TaxID=2997907 RepID=UPI00227D2DBC|nr:DUF1822 family protein [Leptolyngbya sp. GGD]MCY6494270.1 DUF1822 family protein [Leptolyngbya sp. GGD]